MSKGNIFPGQPIVGQVLKLIPREMIDIVTKKHKSNHYYKTFKTFDHVVMMLYAVMSGSESIRAVVLGLLASENRLQHLGIKKCPPRSTISDGNKDRDSEVFASLYFQLHGKYAKLLPDSRNRFDVLERLKIVDSTTMTLFQEILKAAGRTPADGKRKGGIKAHTVIDSGTDLPEFVCFSASARHDRPFLKRMKFEKGDIVVYDKAYTDYKIFYDWTQEGIFFCIRQKEDALYEVVQDFEIADACDKRIKTDQQIRITVPETGETVLLRRIEFWDEVTGSYLVFLTNIFFLNADKIAQIYKRRWQIELLFKRLKQNFPLKYFLGDNVNAIEIQIWCCMIAHLLYKVILSQTKRKWAFSNFSDTIRQHLFTYTDLQGFLADPEGKLRQQILERSEQAKSNQLEFFPP